MLCEFVDVFLPPKQPVQNFSISMGANQEGIDFFSILFMI